MSGLASPPRPTAPSSPPFSFHPISSPSPDASQHDEDLLDGSLHRATPRTLPSSSRATSNFLCASSTRMGSTVNKIEQIIENVLDNVNRGKELSIPFSRRAKQRGGRVPSLQNQSQSQGNDAARQQPRGFVSFPGTTEAESKLFSGQQIPSLLDALHEQLDATCHLMIHATTANRL